MNLGGAEGRGDFAETFDTALSARGIALLTLCERLHARGLTVSIATLSRWRSGQRRPDPVRSAEIVSAVEQELGMAVGALSKAVAGRSRRLGSVAPLTESTSMQRAASEAFATMSAESADVLRILSVQEIIDVDARGGVARASMILMLQCVRETARSFDFVLPTLTPADVPAQLRVLAGGRAFPRVAAGHPGYVVELDRPLAAGETGMLSLRFLFSAAQPPQRHFAFMTRRPIRELIQLFRFDRGHVPEWAEALEETPERTRVTNPSLEGATAINRIRSGFGPGRLVMRWGWDDD